MNCKIDFQFFTTAILSLSLSSIVCAENANILQRIPDFGNDLKSYTTQQKITLLDQANAESESKYGNIYLPSDFWYFSYDKIPDANDIDVSSLGRKSILERTFNGSFSGLSHGPAVSEYFTTLIEAYSHTCRNMLGSNLSPLTNTITETTTDTYGSYSRTREGTTVYVKPRYAKTYKDAFNRGHTGSSKYLYVYKHIKHLMKIESCDSKINSQLIENLYRTINGMSSIQKESKNNLESKSKGSNDERAGRTATFLYYDYQDSKPGHIEYVFANPDSGFIPPSPRRLLELTFERFGKENINEKYRRNFSWKPMLTVKNASAGQLKRMTVSYMLATTSDTLIYFKHLADGWSDWDPALKNNQSLSNKLYSHFVSLVGDQKHRVVECLYEGGGYLVYWMDTKPKGAEPEELRRFYKYHPLLVVQEKRDKCPAILHKGNLGKDYIYNGFSINANSQTPSLPAKAKATINPPLIKKHKKPIPKQRPIKKKPVNKQQPVNKTTPAHKPNKTSIKDYYKETEKLSRDKRKAIANCDSVEGLDARAACLKKVCHDMETLASAGKASDALKATAKTCKGDIHYKLRKIESSR